MEFKVTKKDDFTIEAQHADGRKITVSYVKHPGTHRHLMKTAKVGDTVDIPAAESNQNRFYCTEATMRSVKTVDTTTGAVREISFLESQKALLELDSIESQRRQMADRERLIAAQASLAEKALA